GGEGGYIDVSSGGANGVSGKCVDRLREFLTAQGMPEGTYEMYLNSRDNMLTLLDGSGTRWQFRVTDVEGGPTTPDLSCPSDDVVRTAGQSAWITPEASRSMAGIVSTNAEDGRIQLADLNEEFSARLGGAGVSASLFASTKGDGNAASTADDGGVGPS